jgi:ABC-2 type transport system permease protein
MADTAPTARLMAALVVHHLRSFWRNPFGAFFTVVFPLVLVVILGGLFGDSALIVGQRWVPQGETLDGSVAFSQVIIPAVAAFAVAMAGYVHLATATASDRQDGTLKRLRSTPLPPTTYLTSRMVTAAVIGTTCAAVVIAYGVAAVAMPLTGAGLPLAALAIVLSAAAFAALGLMVAGLTPPGAVSAVAFGTILPLAFISEVFLHGMALPPVISAAGWAFPLRHLSVLLRETLTAPGTSGMPTAVSFAVIVAWGAVALAVTRATFAWDASSPRRRRRQATSDTAATSTAR